MMKKEEMQKQVMADEKFKYAYNLYIEMGKVLQYDPLYAVASFWEKIKIGEKNVNYDSLTDFRVICTTWAKMYIARLKKAGINAKFVTNEYHDWVEFSIKNVEIVADLIENQRDIHGIKFGKRITGFHFKDDEDIDLQKLDTEINYYKGIYTDEVLEMIKGELTRYKQSKEDYKLKVFESLSLILNNYHEQLDFCSGISFIHFYLKMMLIKDEGFETYYPEEKDFRMYYPLIFDNQTIWYCYQKSPNGYQLNPVFSSDLGNYKLKEIYSHSRVIYKLVKKKKL